MQETKKNFKSIQIKPKGFPDLLRSIGFQSAEEVTVPQGGAKSKGFKRPILVCRKGGASASSTTATTTEEKPEASPTT